MQYISLMNHYEGVRLSANIFNQLFPATLNKLLADYVDCNDTNTKFQLAEKINAVLYRRKRHA